MSVIRQRRAETFTLVPNGSVNHPGLTLRAKGLHAVLLSKPDDWSFSAERLAQECAEGRDAIRAAMAELRGVGFVRQRKEQSESGRWSTVIEVFDIAQPVLEEVAPGPENPSSVRPAVTQLPKPENPTSGEPTVGGSGAEVRTENQGLRNKTRSTPSGAARREDEPTAVGALPAGPATDTLEGRGTAATRLTNYFKRKALEARPTDDRGRTEVVAGRSVFKKLIEQEEVTTDEAVAMIDLFFAGDTYWKPGRSFLQSFGSVRFRLLRQVRANAVVEGETWKERRLRQLGVEVEAPVATTWAERKAARLRELGVSA